jgi:large subunit ribosomal protein L13
MKTYSAKPQDIVRDWFVVDATDKVLGRLASQIALRLRGKHKVIFTPHMDTGDFIVVTNVEKLRVTGNKADDKLYHRHSGYPGGITTTTFAQMQARFPGRALELLLQPVEALPAHRADRHRPRHPAPAPAARPGESRLPAPG